MTSRLPSDIVRRKSDHIDIVLQKDVGFGRLTNGFEAVQFTHNAIPELMLSEVDLSSSLFGRKLAAPLLISSMTGGPERADTINTNLAQAAEALGLAIAVGSQRVALEEQGMGGLSAGLRQIAPSVPLLGNIGAAQLLCQDATDRVRRAISMIEADAVYIHLNPLQEAVQDGGDTDWRGVLRSIETIVRDGIPIAVKEVGFGLSANVVRRLVDAGVSVVDVAGAGGTNWARVEGNRSPGSVFDEIAAAFTEWGVPTAQAVMDAREVAPEATIIASGGIKTGVDVAKAIRLGADLAGQAAATLSAALKGPEEVVTHFQKIIDTLRIVCFCTGSENLAALRLAPLTTSISAQSANL